MAGREFFHNLEEYQKVGLESFLEHVRDYCASRRAIPVSRANSVNGWPSVTFTFSEHLLERFLEDTDSLKKPYEAAIKYGFRGYSRGGKNGIFCQRSPDGGLAQATQRLMSLHRVEMEMDLDLRRKGLDLLRKVKIVWHNSSGERVVGVYNPENNRIIFLDLASY